MATSLSSMSDQSRKLRVVPSSKTPATPPIYEDLRFAFYCFLVPGLLAAYFSPILDCDETYNYWEPTHFLRHGFGMQTWEYSPEYAIRSWLYISLHAAVGRLVSVLPFTTKAAEFYLLRAMLAFACAACETRLFQAICRMMNPRVGLLFMLCMVCSPGMFHASVAFLPSSFAMYMTMLGMAAFMDWFGKVRTAEGIMWFGIGAIVGWPFAVVLVVPFLFEEVVFAMLDKTALEEAAWRVVDGVARSSIALALGVAVDLFFYHQVEFVPYNIVKYNVFSRLGHGPAIYGTEPWHYYFRNLALNFNIWFLLALISLPLIRLQSSFGTAQTGLRFSQRNYVFMTPFYLWFAIFTLQPHKEERFMYPVYPALALNAAMSLHVILTAVGSFQLESLMGFRRAGLQRTGASAAGKIKLVAVLIVLGASALVGLLRVVGVVTAYSAPLHVHNILQDAAIISPSEDIICYGKEWYRFPSSYFLPQTMRARFVKSEFDGLLPGAFSEASIGFGLYPTYLIPPGMNNKNEEDVGKHLDLSRCPLLVDSYFPGSSATKLEPHHVLNSTHWAEVTCHPFLDASRTHFLGRMLWIPDSTLIPERFRRRWGKYCLLRRVDRTGRK